MPWAVFKAFGYFLWQFVVWCWFSFIIVLFAYIYSPERCLVYSFWLVCLLLARKNLSNEKWCYKTSWNFYWEVSNTPVQSYKVFAGLSRPMLQVRHAAHTHSFLTLIHQSDFHSLLTVKQERHSNQTLFFSLSYFPFILLTNPYLYFHCSHPINNYGLNLSYSVD